MPFRASPATNDFKALRQDDDNVAQAQTLAERVLFHLRKHAVEPDAVDVPPEVTQEGIAVAIGAQVAHVSRALKALEIHGHVTAHLAHPRGAKRRSRAYSLTTDGYDRSRHLTMPTGPAESPVPGVQSPTRVSLAPAIPAGRARQADALAASLAEAANGAVRVTLVEGDSGMGKSRLLNAFAARARSSGARVLTGTGAPTGAEQLVGPVGRALEPLAFERRFNARTAGSPRERALSAAVEAIEVAARIEPVVLLLDDIHLAGASVAEFLHGLALALPRTTRVLLVLAFRQEEGWQLPNGPLYTALMPLRLVQGARHLALPPLDAAGIAQLLDDARAHHVPADIATRIARESGGNPLYALAMADAMLDGIDEEDYFPASVRALATSRFAGLSPAEHGVLQAAAVCGAEFDYDLLRKLDDGGETALLSALDVILDRLLLEEASAPGDVLRLRFTHPKVREAVLVETAVTRRRWLESRLAAAAQGR